jgi:tetratricopeptide (TPR) repeat protein
MTSGHPLLAFWALAGAIAALGAADGHAGSETVSQPRVESPLLKRARELFANRQFAELVSVCTRVLQDDGSVAEAYHLRGKARLLASRDGAAAALDDFTAAIKNARTFAEAHYDRGLLYLETGAVGPALSDFDQAMRQGMTGRDVSFYRGMAYLQSERFTEAIDDFSAVIRRDPELAAAYLNRGIARYRLGNLKEALADDTRAIELDPRLARAYLNRGVVRLTRGDLDSAVADFDQAIEQSHRSGDLTSIAAARFDRGKAFYLKKDYPRAIDDWERIVRDRDATDSMALDYLGMAYSQVQNEAKAARYFEDAIRADSAHTYAPAHAHLGAARYNQRDFPAAIKECTIALEIDPTLAEAYATRSLAFRTLKQPDRARADEEQAAQLRLGKPAGPRVVDARRR